jgi:DNA-binding protein H-NS
LSLLEPALAGKNSPRRKDYLSNNHRVGATRRSRTIAPKYRGPNGELWSGRGRPPRWLQHALSQGRRREDFLIS